MRKCLPLTTLRHDGPIVIDLVAAEQKLIDETEKKMCALPDPWAAVNYSELELRTLLQLGLKPGDALLDMKTTGRVVDYSTILYPRGAGKTSTLRAMTKKFIELAKRTGTPILTTTQEYSPRPDKRPGPAYATRDDAATKALFDSLSYVDALEKTCDIATSLVRCPSSSEMGRRFTIHDARKRSEKPLTFFVTKGGT